MNPIGTFDIVLPDELVEVAVSFDVVEPEFARFEILFAIWKKRKAEVGGLSFGVLGVGGSTYSFVKCFAAEARPDGDRFAIPLTEWLNDISHKKSKTELMFCVGSVGDFLGCGCCRCQELGEREMR